VMAQRALQGLEGQHGSSARFSCMATLLASCRRGWSRGVSVLTQLSGVSR
jgi:hypothetical protein